MMKALSFLLFFLLLSAKFTLTFSQNKLIDSLKNVLITQKLHDTTALIIEHEIAVEYRVINVDTTLFLAKKIYEKAKKLKFERIIGTSTRLLGYCFWVKGEYDSALVNYEKAIIISHKIKDLKAESACFNNLGLVYANQGNYAKAIASYLSSLKIKEKMNDIAGVATTINNIGIIYQDQGDFQHALKNYRKAAEIRKTLKNQTKLAQSYNNIGYAFKLMKAYDSAIIYFEQGMKIALATEDNVELSIILSNFADTYILQGNPDEAMPLLISGLDLCKKNQFKEQIIYFHINFAKYYIAKKNYAKAYQEAKEAITLGKLSGNVDALQNAFQQGMTAAKNVNKLADALEWQTAFYVVRDSMQDKKNLKNTLSKEFEYKEDKIKYEQEKKELAFQAERAEQKRIQYMYMGVAGTFLIVLILIAIGLKQKQKANKLLAAQNSEILHQKIEIAEKNDNLNQANEELQQQQEELIVLNENLEGQKQTLQKSYHSLELLSEVGKQIQESLDIRQIIQTVYFHVNALMKVEGFGIGLYNENSQTLDFEAYIERGEELPFHQDNLANNNLFSSLCYNEQREVILNNLSVEYPDYLPILENATAGENVKSLIYLPLTTEKNKIGVITVQSFELNAYQEQHLSMLHHIANYTASALQKADAFRFINQQKHTIESTYHKLKHTTEQLDKSIQYASNVQAVVMPEEKELRRFFSDLFILYRPKDIVSGDFYWFSQISEEHAVFCLADCTGHGVPGAFMSMLGCTLLHETVNVKKVNDDPARILKNVHHAIRKILKQEEKRNNDGMDISLCVFKKNKADKTIHFTFAGAKSSMLYISNNEVFDLKGDKQYLGGEEMQYDFTNHSLILPENTLFYLYSDGFQDQNNAARKRLGSTAFKQALLANAHENLSEQKNKLSEILQNHQANEQQRDDISVVGFQI